METLGLQLTPHQRRFWHEVQQPKVAKALKDFEELISDREYRRRVREKGLPRPLIKAYFESGKGQ